jgi:selenide,water dikinase
MGHSYEMAQGSGCTIHLKTGDIPYHPEAYELAEMGFIPAGAYRNREYAEKGVKNQETISLAMADILYDPQTSGGLLIAVDGKKAQSCLTELRENIPEAAIIGYVTEKTDQEIVLE